MKYQIGKNPPALPAKPKVDAGADNVVVAAGFKMPEPKILAGIVASLVPGMRLVPWAEVVPAVKPSDGKPKEGVAEVNDGGAEGPKLNEGAVAELVNNDGCEGKVGAFCVDCWAVGPKLNIDGVAAEVEIVAAFVEAPKMLPSDDPGADVERFDHNDDPAKIRA